ncbi:MAG: hypothetical protein M3Z23_06670 [Acidobacteriota bacterium]|nr:hypothetical protein [Acidobacteriota bacterium]
MNYLVLGLLFTANLVIGQEQKHLTAVPLSGGRAATLTALNIERGGQYPSAIHLTGGVEIKTPICLPAGRHGKLICDGSMILRADEATYHEDSGEIEASGSVTVTPLRHEPAAK